MSVTMEFTTNTTPAIVTLVTEDFARVGWLDVFSLGRAFGVAYGDMDAPPSGTTWPAFHPYDFYVQRYVDGVKKGPKHHLVGTVGRGQYVIRHWGAPASGMLPGTAPWQAWFSAGADRVPSTALDDHELPDDEPHTEATGSGRIFTMRCPAVVAAIDAFDDSAMLSIERWCEYQGQRGLNYYRSSRLYEPFMAGEAGDKRYVGRGYSASGGGFHTLFSAKLPPHEPPGPHGLMAPHATHLTIQPLIGAAYVMGDGMALRMAIHTVQAVGTHVLAVEKFSSRAYGRFFLACAELAPAIKAKVAGTENIQTIVNAALANLKAANRGGAPAPDNGKTAEGSHHLLNADVAAFCARMVPPITDQAVIQEYARSDATWFVTQLWYGLHSLKTLWTAYGIAVPSEVDAQMQFAAEFIALACRHHIAVQSSGTPSAAPSGTWAEVSAVSISHSLRLAEGGGWGDVDNAVLPRFWLPVLFVMSQHYGEAEWKEAADTMYAYCKANGTWGGSYEDWALEAMPALAITGWDE
jgi:hypothetical protein